MSVKANFGDNQGVRMGLKVSWEKVVSTEFIYIVQRAAVSRQAELWIKYKIVNNHGAIGRLQLGG